MHKEHVHYIISYLSNITQLDLALLASAATAPQKEPERILILIFIYLNVDRSEKQNVST